RAEDGRGRHPQRTSGDLSGHARRHGDDPQQPGRRESAALWQAARRTLLEDDGRVRDRTRHRAGTGRHEIRGQPMYRVILASMLVLAPAASFAQGLPNVIEGYYPTQLVAGQTNVLHLGIPGRNDITAVEFEPAAGITVKDIKKGD